MITGAWISKAVTSSTPRYYRTTLSFNGSAVTNNVMVMHPQLVGLDPALASASLPDVSKAFTFVNISLKMISYQAQTEY